MCLRAKVKPGKKIKSKKKREKLQLGKAAAGRKINTCELELLLRFFFSSSSSSPPPPPLLALEPLESQVVPQSSCAAPLSVWTSSPPAHIHPQPLLSALSPLRILPSARNVPLDPSLVPTVLCSYDRTLGPISSSFTILTALKSNFSLYTTKGVRENGLIDSRDQRASFLTGTPPILHGYMDEYLTRARNKDSLLLGEIHPRGILILPLPPLHMFGCVCVCVCGSLLFSFHLQVRAKGSSSQSKDRPGDLAVPVQSTSVRRLS